MNDVLVVDHEPQLLRALRITLTARGYDVHTAATGRRALAEATARPAGPGDPRPRVCRTSTGSR